MVARELNAEGNPAMAKHPVGVGGGWGCLQILLVALFYRNWDNRRLDKPLGSHADLLYLQPIGRNTF